MWARVKRPSCNGHRYYSGIRKIEVCDRWKSFEAFYQDTGPRPDGYTLGRIDSFGDYEPGNVVYELPKAQYYNCRNRAPIEMMGQKTTLEKLVKKGVPAETVIYIQRSRYKSRQQGANG